MFTRFCKFNTNNVFLKYPSKYNKNEFYIIKQKKRIVELSILIIKGKNQ